MSETSLIYGLNAGGFVRMRLPEIRQLILAELKSRTGYDFDDSPDSFTGQMIAIFAERMAALWEQLELAYLSPYPVTAQGISLDLAVSYSGVRRLEPARSRAVVYVLGAPGAICPAGTVIQASVASDGADTPPRFFLQYDVVCTKAKAVTARLTVLPPVTAGAEYWIEIGGVRRAHIAQAGQIPGQVTALLDALWNNLTTADGGSINIFPTEETTIDFSPNFQIDYIGSQGVALSEAFGPVIAAQRTITKILNAPPGISAIYNPFAAVAGQLEESDATLRARYKTGVYQLGAATAPSIDANIRQNVKGITSARLLVNENDTPSGDGLPPHSIELIIEGGDDQEIFNEIHNVKAAGIISYGNRSGFVKGADGYNYPIRFSRPDNLWVWVRISYTTNPEKPVPGDLKGMIVQAILDEGNSWQPGEDLIVQRLQAAPFRVTNALRSLTVTAVVTSTNSQPPAITSYSVGDYPADARQKMTFDISRILID